MIHKLSKDLKTVYRIFIQKRAENRENLYVN